MKISFSTLACPDFSWTDIYTMAKDLGFGGIEIHGLDANGQAEGVTVYHAGTKLEDGKFLTNGGRVLGVTALGDTLEQALSRAYAGVEAISFEGAMYRKDIGRTHRK